MSPTLGCATPAADRSRHLPATAITRCRDRGSGSRRRIPSLRRSPWGPWSCAARCAGPRRRCPRVSWCSTRRRRSRRRPSRQWAQVLMVLPMVLMMGAMILMFSVGFASGGSAFATIRFVVFGMFGVAMLLMVGAAFMQGGGPSKREMGYARRMYLRSLAQHRVRVGRTARRQRTALWYLHPDPATLWSVAASYRLWERRRGDADFGVARIGLGAQTLATELIAPDTKPMEQLEPLSALALRRFITAYSVGAGPAARHGGQRFQPHLPARRRPRRRAGAGDARPARHPAVPGRPAHRGVRRPGAARPSGSGSSGCRTRCTRNAPTRSARSGWSPRRSPCSRRCWTTCSATGPGSTRRTA